MAGGFDQARSNAILDATHPNTGTSTVGAETYTGPIKVRLMATNGSATANGTEITPGGGYTAGGAAVTYAAAGTGSKSTNAALTWTNMPATTINGVEEWDQGGTPKRMMWGPLTAAKTTNAGDTFTIASGSLTDSLA